MTLEEVRDFDHELPQEPGREERLSHGTEALMGLFAQQRQKPRGA